MIKKSRLCTTEQTVSAVLGHTNRVTVFRFNDVEVERVPIGNARSTFSIQLTTPWSRLWHKLMYLMEEGWIIEYEEYYTTTKRDQQGKFLPKHLCCRGSATFEEKTNV